MEPWMILVGLAILFEIVKRVWWREGNSGGSFFSESSGDSDFEISFDFDFDGDGGD